MSDMMPTKFDFDTITGLSQTAEPIARPLSTLKGYFSDADAFDAAAAQGDPLVYEYFDMGVPETSGNVAYGTTSIKPGKVGDEYYMTKGHFHTVLDTAEVYYCLSGHGGMMMETPEGKVEWREMRKGDAVYVPGRWAHRSINISRQRALRHVLCLSRSCWTRLWHDRRQRLPQAADRTRRKADPGRQSALERLTI